MEGDDCEAQNKIDVRQRVRYLRDNESMPYKKRSSTGSTLIKTRSNYAKTMRSEKLLIIAFVLRVQQ